MLKLFLLTLAILLSDAPQNLRPPSDQNLILQVHGVGDQIYTCKDSSGTFAWVLKAPDAQLFSAENKLVGRHFAGPTWEAEDKSAIVGKVVSSAPSPDADSIPWLLLTAVQNKGNGIFSAVATIQRLNTKGGKAAANTCNSSHLGDEQRVHYEADYVFYGNAAKPPQAQ